MSSRRRKGPLLVCLLIGYVLTPGTHAAGLPVQDVFPDAMHHVKVHSGATATFNCSVAPPAACTQWAWNHKTVRIFESEKAVSSRSEKYSQEYTGISGNHVLRIANVSLQDEGPVACMAMCPDNGTATTDWVETVAKLIILVPPSDPVITYNRNMVSTVETRMGESVNLTCSVHDGRLYTRLVWRRGSTLTHEIPGFLTRWEYTEDAAYSTVTFTTGPEDDNTDFTCSVESEALPKPVAVQVKMSVKYPPVMPVITRLGGCQTGIEMGNRTTIDVRLKCSTEDGNPPPELTWFVYDHMVSGSKEKATASGAVDSILLFPASRRDNGVAIRCEASNELMKEGIGADYRLELLFGPASVTVSSDVPSGQMAQSNTTVQVSCYSKASNPAPDIHWFIDGVPYQEKRHHAEVTPDGSVSRSRLKLRLLNTHVEVLCVAVNPRTPEKSAAAITIKVDSPRLDQPVPGSVGVSDADGNTLSPAWSLTTIAPAGAGNADRKLENPTMVIVVPVLVSGAVLLFALFMYAAIRRRGKKCEEMANRDSSGSSKGHREVHCQTNMDTSTDTARSGAEKTPTDPDTRSKRISTPSAVRPNAARTYDLDETYHSPYGNCKRWTALEPEQGIPCS